MARDNLTWNGPAVSAKWKAAQIAGVNMTLSATVAYSKRNHPWKNRTTTLERDIVIFGRAEATDTGVTGAWGVKSERKQALALEFGAVIKPVNAQALKIPQPDGSFRFVKQVTIPAYPYLRPAADAIYPQLTANIRRAHERSTGGE